MHIRKRIALATGVASAVLAIAGTGSYAARPTSGARPSSVPADWVPLVDDTGTIRVSVPSTWTDIRTSGYAPATGEVLPSIVASPSIEDFGDTFGVPGVWLVADTFSPDTATVAEEWGRSSGCSQETSQPYIDGALTGTHVIYRGCGDGSAELHVIAANSAEHAFTTAVQVQITGPEELPVLAGIVASLDVAMGGAVPAPPETPLDAPAESAAPPTGPTSTAPPPSISLATLPETTTTNALDPVISFQEAMQSSGLKLSYDQADCWLESVMQIETSDMAAVQAAGEACGVEF